MRFTKLIIERFRLIGGLLFTGLLLYTLIAKVKWQLYPLYLLLIFYASLFTLEFFGWLKLTPIKSVLIVFVSLVLLISPVFLFYIFSTQSMPEVSGNFDIGTQIFELEDKNREEVFSEKRGVNRKIKYQIWYPSDSVTGFQKAKWITEGRLLTRQLGKTMFAPSFILDHIVDIDSNSYLNAPLSDELKSYPVIVISHGWKGFRELHTDYAEELASHGYIAISIDHSYGGQAVKFEDGSVAYLNREALQSLSMPETFFSSAQKLAKMYGEDVGIVLDDLERLMVEEGEFKGRLDLKSIGSLSHSTGGAGDVYLTLKDNRIKALIGLDSWLEALEKESLSAGLTIPALFLRSEKWSDKKNNINLEVLVKNSPDAKIIQTYGTRHVDFTMAYMVSPYTGTVGYTGKHGGREASNLVKELSLEFFDYHLRDKGSLNSTALEDLIEEKEFIELIDDY